MAGKTTTPLTDSDFGQVQLARDLLVGFARRGRQNDLAPLHQTVRGRGRAYEAVQRGLGHRIQRYSRSDRPFALSVGMTMELPLRSGGEIGYEPTLLLAKSFHKLQIHASVISEIEQWKESVAYNVAAVRPIRRDWFPTFEWNGRRTGKKSFYVTPGLYRHLHHRAEIGIGIPLGVGRIANSRGIVLKMSWELGGDKE